MSSALLVLTVVGPPIPEAVVRDALRHDALPVALGVIFVTLGLGSLIGFGLRRRSPDPTILWFGFFAALFGLRLLILADIVRFAAGFGDHPAWFFLAAAISYIIPLSALLFLREAFPDWRPVLSWLLRFQVAVALIGIVCDQVVDRPEALRRVNSVLMLAGFAALIIALFRQKGSSTSIRSLRLGALAFSFAVVLKNLSNLHVLPVRVDLEGFGFAAFLGALAHVIIGRMQEREQRLVELNARRHAAEEASKVKSAVLAHISHELRTPLNAILGYTEMLRETAEDAGDQSMMSDLDRVRAASRHLLTLIDSVLDISKIEAGKMVVSYETVAVEPLVQDVVGIVGGAVAQNRNALVVQIDPSAGTMQTDATKLRQILVNLLGNAAKFTRDGTVTIEVARQRREADEELLFRVRDTGAGMTGEEVARLFRPFQQANTQTARQFGGTGLGLALSRRLCELMRGEILVESQPGVGSVFTVRLPAAAVATPDDEAGAGPAADVHLPASVVTTIAASTSPSASPSASAPASDAGTRGAGPAVVPMSAAPAAAMARAAATDAADHTAPAGPLPGVVPAGSPAAAARAGDGIAL